MSVINENENGWVICSKTYFNNIYELCIDDNFRTRKLKLKDAFFDIRTPFFTNSKSKKCGQMKAQSKCLVKKKKNKNIFENKLDDSKDIVFILENINKLIITAKNLKHLETSEITAQDWFENNGEARKAASQVLNCTSACIEKNSVFHHGNASLNSVIKKFGIDEYLLPPQSTFYLCDISSFFEIIDEKFDVIVIDPPWVNKSVKRKKSYSSLNYEFLRSIPFENITKPGCLIVVWITNSSSAASFVTDVLFPKCNVFVSTMWHWCKITKKGDFVYPVHSHHKKPYENLLLGRVQYDNLFERPVKEINAKKIIVSVPSSIHSSKPPLVEILKPYLKSDANCLEMFARYLLPGWKSVGNEVLKLQNIKLFDAL